MRGVRIAPGVTAATFAAGPLFFIGLGMAAWVSSERPAFAIGLHEPLEYASAAISAMLFGAPVAILPNCLGALTLGALGRGNAGVRLPPFWALVGSGCGIALDATFSAVSPTAELVPVFTVTSTACALICRWGTRWDD